MSSFSTAAPPATAASPAAGVRGPARTRTAPPPPSRPAPPEPDFGPHVRVFGPGTPAAEIQEALEAGAREHPFDDGSGAGSGAGAAAGTATGVAADAGGTAGPGADPRAFLFRPGTYRVDARLGPRTWVAGLGSDPRDVTLEGALRAARATRPDVADAAPAGLRQPLENLVAPGGRPMSGEGKPYLFVDAGGAYRVYLPAPPGHGTCAAGAGRRAHGWSVPIDRFLVAHPGDTARTLNRALAQGRHLLLTPGVYRLTDTVRVKWAGTVVLGLGCVTLTPVGGTVPMTVADARGVRIAGLLFDAGPVTPPVLLEVGRSGGGRSDPREPACVQDVLFRIGGAEGGRRGSALVVHSEHVWLDRVWAWRAGQGAGAGWGVGGGAPDGDARDRSRAATCGRAAAPCPAAAGTTSWPVP